MKTITTPGLLRLILFPLLAGMMGLNLAYAQQVEQMDTEPTLATLQKYSEKGADTCLKCHDEDSEFPVLNIFKTKHAMAADTRTPFGGLQCESCHGPAVNNEWMQGDQPEGWGIP